MEIPQVKSVKPLQEYNIEVKLNSGETKIFDVKPIIEKGIFQKLKDPEEFKKIFVNPESKTVTWANGLDLSPMLFR